MTPLFQKANLIFGMGMLEMGITFSFQQLILDAAAVSDIEMMFPKAVLPAAMKEDSYVADLVATYKGEKPVLAETSAPSFQRYDKKDMMIAGKANEIAGEIISTHRTPKVERIILKEIRRIVSSAE